MLPGRYIPALGLFHQCLPLEQIGTLVSGLHERTACLLLEMTNHIHKPARIGNDSELVGHQTTTPFVLKINNCPLEYDTPCFRILARFERVPHELIY